MLITMGEAGVMPERGVVSQFGKRIRFRALALGALGHKGAVALGQFFLRFEAVAYVMSGMYGSLREIGRLGRDRALCGRKGLGPWEPG